VPGSPCETVVYCTVFMENELLSFCTVTHYTKFSGKFSVWIHIPSSWRIMHLWIISVLHRLFKSAHVCCCRPFIIMSQVPPSLIRDISNKYEVCVFAH